MKIDIPKEVKANVKVAHLNVRSLKSREHFSLVKDTIIRNSFDIFTISETWLDATVNDANIEIQGYQLFRQDRGPDKPGGDLCIYAKSNLKASIIGDLSPVSDDGFQQLWLRVQCRNYKSFLVCNVYRPPSTPVGCFECLANNFVDSLLLNLEIIVLCDLNCNLLYSCPEANALFDFISAFSLNQIVEKPTRITENSKSLIDVIITTSKTFVNLSDVLTCSSVIIT